MEDSGHRSSLTALRSLLEEADRDRIFVSDLLSAIEDRAVLALVLLFSLPNIIPMPPGTSAVLGAPLVILTAQWLLGAKPWLPSPLLHMSLDRRDLARWLDRATPWLMRADSMLRPRLAPLVRPCAQRMAGILGMVLALILLLPIPLGNAPPALAISVLAAGFLRRDGVWVLAGTAIGTASIAIAWKVVSLAFRAGAGLLAGTP
jgi:hypothetical protein